MFELALWIDESNAQEREECAGDARCRNLNRDTGGPGESSDVCPSDALGSGDRLTSQGRRAGATIAQQLP